MADSPFERRNFPLTLEEADGLRSIGRPIRRPAGHKFFAEGEETDFALLIEKGHVKVMAGQPVRIVAIRRAGDFVGEMAALSKRPRSASVVAFDEVEALFLTAAKWVEFLYGHPRAMHAQLAVFEERLEQATRKVVESDLAIEQRLAKACIELVDDGLGEPSADGIVLRISQLDLASLVGASKLNSVKKIIRSFKDAELISTSRNAITLLSLPAIADIADGETVATG